MQRFFGSVSGTIVVAAVMIAAVASPSSAQAARGTKSAYRPALEIAVTYDATHSMQASGSPLWMQGGTVQMHGQFYRGWGVVADISDAHIANIHGTGVGLDLVTATFGPRYTWMPAHTRYSLFTQALGGEAWGMNSVFPHPGGATTTDNSLAVKAGGGLNVCLTAHIALRAIEVDYLRTQFPNSTSNVQNSLRVAAGVVVRLP